MTWTKAAIGMFALVAMPPEEQLMSWGWRVPFLISFPADQIHVERFVPPPPGVDPAAGPYTLVLARTGTSQEVPAGVTMIDAIAACGGEVATSCGGGIRGACRVDVLAGTPLHRDRFLTLAERAKSLLACVAGCAGGRLVLDL